VNGEFSREAITPVIFWIQSFWSAADSACHQQKRNTLTSLQSVYTKVWKKYYWNMVSLRHHKHALHSENQHRKVIVTCNVYALMGEIILKQNLRSFSSASILMVEVLRSIVWDDSESSVWDGARWFKNLNRPNTPAPSPAVCCDADPCCPIRKEKRCAWSTKETTSDPFFGLVFYRPSFPPPLLFHPCFVSVFWLMWFHL
jgi:hypothetical protein